MNNSKMKCTRTRVCEAQTRLTQQYNCKGK